MDLVKVLADVEQLLTDLGVVPPTILHDGVPQTAPVLSPVAPAATTVATALPVTPGHEVTEEPPLSVTTRATMWGLNWNGTNDTGDLDSTQPDGNSRGFFTDLSTGKAYETHNKTLLGASLPREVLLSTFIGVDSWQSEPILTVWRSYAADLREWVLQHQPTLTIDSAGKYTISNVVLADAGPTASTHNGLDLTYAAGHELMTYGGATCTYRIMVAGKPVIIKGWDWSNRRVIGS